MDHPSPTSWPTPAEAGQHGQGTAKPTTQHPPSQPEHQKGTTSQESETTREPEATIQQLDATRQETEAPRQITETTHQGTEATRSQEGTANQYTAPAENHEQTREVASQVQPQAYQAQNPYWAFANPYLQYLLYPNPYTVALPHQDFVDGHAPYAQYNYNNASHTPFHVNQAIDAQQNFNDTSQMPYTASNPVTYGGIPYPYNNELATHVDTAQRMDIRDTVMKMPAQAEERNKSAKPARTVLHDPLRVQDKQLRADAPAYAPRPSPVMPPAEQALVHAPYATTLMSPQEQALLHAPQATPVVLPRERVQLNSPHATPVMRLQEQVLLHEQHSSAKPPTRAPQVMPMVSRPLTLLLKKDTPVKSRQEQALLHALQKGKEEQYDDAYVSMDASEEPIVRVPQWEPDRQNACYLTPAVVTTRSKNRRPVQRFHISVELNKYNRARESGADMSAYPPPLWVGLRTPPSSPVPEDVDPLTWELKRRARKKVDMSAWSPASNATPVSQFMQPPLGFDDWFSDDMRLAQPETQAAVRPDIPQHGVTYTSSIALDLDPDALAMENTEYISPCPRKLEIIHHPGNSKTYSRQNFNGPFFTDWLYSPLPPLSPEAEDKAWVAKHLGSRYTRLDAYYESLVAADKHEKSPKATRSTTADDEKVELGRIMMPMIENLLSYVQGPIEQRRDYWAPWVGSRAPEWAYDKSTTGYQSLIDENWINPPARIGRDARYQHSPRATRFNEMPSVQERGNERWTSLPVRFGQASPISGLGRGNSRVVFGRR